MQDRAVGKDHFEAHDVVGRHSVLDSPHAAGILRHIAADGGEFPACRVGRVKEPLGGAVVVEIDRANPGLGPDHHVALVELDDLRHALQGQGDAALEGNASAGAAARGTPRRDRDPLLVGNGHELRQFLRRQGPHDEVGPVHRQQRYEGCIIGIAKTVDVGIKGIFLPHDIADFFLDVICDHPNCLPSGFYLNSF